VCGCGNEVVTPFSPTDWQFTFDGETITLSPSIGNWNFKCQSHYWITNSKIVMARKWSKQHIESNREYDKRMKEKQYKKRK
jgi:hypothetical protein